MISVVMPSHDREAYLADAINSVLNQSYKDLELIIVDDGSDDDSFRLYEYFQEKDKRVKVIYIKPSGISVARMTGIQAAQGDFIAVMDSDDLMHPDRLKLSLKAIKGADFVYSPYYLANSRGIVENSVIPHKKVTKEDVMSNFSWPHVTIMGRKEIFEYRPDFKVNDDAWLMWHLFKNDYKAKMIDQPLMIVRLHQGSTSASKQKEIAKTQKAMDVEYAK